MIDFYLGVHMANWLETASVPLFVSEHRLRRYRRDLPVAQVPWALDSGGFTELAKHREYVTTHTAYVAAVSRYQDQVGRMVWCAPQDYMCEPEMLERTGLTVAEHQKRSTASVLDLRDAGLPVIPVLQGYANDEYLRHADDYLAAGIDLADEPLVGLGSICRRQRTTPIAELVTRLTDDGLRIHGFGVSLPGLRKFGQLLTTADSMAWSFAGRRRGHLCGRPHTEKSCRNCLWWAMMWRDMAFDRAAA